MYTYLLQCFLFRKELSGGKICVMGGEPGDRQLGLPGPLVGFMPQSIRLVGSYLDSLVGSSLECLLGSSMEWLVG